MQDLTQDEWRQQAIDKNKGIILDVRTPHEVAEGVIPNAKHMDIQNAPSFMEHAQELDKEKNYYVYCRSGGRSAQACMILDSMGFKNTFNLQGGITEWTGEKTDL